MHEQEWGKACPALQGTRNQNILRMASLQIFADEILTMEWEAKISLPTTKSGSDKVKAAPPRTRIFGFQDRKISVFHSASFLIK